VSCASVVLMNRCAQRQDFAGAAVGGKHRYITHVRKPTLANRERKKEACMTFVMSCTPASEMAQGDCRPSS
jgi:hypothetical protein